MIAGNRLQWRSRYVLMLDMTWTAADQFRFSIKMGLKKGLALVRGMRRALTDEEQDRVAEKIADQFRHGWRIEQIEPQAGPSLHSALLRNPDETA